MSAWIDQMFEADQVRKHGVVRRSKADVDKYASLADLKAAVKKHGFQLFEGDNDYVVLCDNSGLKPIPV